MPLTANAVGRPFLDPRFYDPLTGKSLESESMGRQPIAMTPVSEQDKKMQEVQRLYGGGIISANEARQIILNNLQNARVDLETTSGANVLPTFDTQTQYPLRKADETQSNRGYADPAFSKTGGQDPKWSPGGYVVGDAVVGGNTTGIVTTTEGLKDSTVYIDPAYDGTIYINPIMAPNEPFFDWKSPIDAKPATKPEPEIPVFPLNAKRKICLEDE